MTPKVRSRWLSNSWFLTTSAIASRLRLDDDPDPVAVGLVAEVADPSIEPSLTSSAMRSTSRDLFCWKGSSGSRSDPPPRRPRTRRGRERDRGRSLYALWTAFRPTMFAPVGKSGPLTCSIRSSTVQSGSLISATVASITSPRLCGGMFVDIPTAIPEEPLTSRLGNAAGNTSGSSSRSS